MLQEIYTPYGFRDRLFVEAAQHRVLLERIQRVFRRYGYQDVETPTVEYLKVYDEERGSIAPVDMYKFVDRDGELLVLRPDLTPAAARVATTYLTEEDLPCRICMTGSTFRYNSRYSAKERELRQTGVELIGADSVLADAEIVEIAVEALRAAGLSTFKIAIGHARLVEQILSLFPEERRAELREYVVSKNFPALYQRLAGMETEEACRALLELTAQTGGIDLVEQGYTYSQKMGLTKIAQIFERLLALHRLLAAEGMSQELVYDLGMTADLHYYTGIVFQGYTDGTGDYVLDGGRYDDLLRQFSKNWPSVGLGIYMNSLLNAMNRQGIAPEVPGQIFLSGTEEETVLQAARILRDGGQDVVLLFGKDRESFEASCQAKASCSLGLWLDPKEDDRLCHQLEERLKEVLADA